MSKQAGYWVRLMLELERDDPKVESKAYDYSAQLASESVAQQEAVKLADDLTKKAASLRQGLTSITNPVAFGAAEIIDRAASNLPKQVSVATAPSEGC